MHQKGAEVKASELLEPVITNLCHEHLEFGYMSLLVAGNFENRNDVY